jgi:hypothetical protein
MAALRFTLNTLQKSTSSKANFYSSRGGRCTLFARRAISLHSTIWKNTNLFSQHNRLFATSSEKWTPPSGMKEGDIPDFPEKELLNKLHDDEETPDEEREAIGTKYLVQVSDRTLTSSFLPSFLNLQQMNSLKE